MTTRSIAAIDCHAHVLARDRPITSDRHTPPPRDYSVGELLGIFDGHGISHGLLTAPSIYLTDNSLLLAALEESSRLRGTVILAPDASMETIEALHARGVCGMRLNWWRKKALPDIRMYQDLFAKVRDAGWHVELFVEGRHMPDVLPVIEASGARLVLDHFGCPDPVEGVRSAGFVKMLDMMSAGQAWVKLSAPYRLAGGDAKAYAHTMLAATGPERLVWASDWPWVGFEQDVTYQRCLDWLSEWVPDPAARHIVLTETPRALFGFE